MDALHDKVVASGCQVIFAPRELESLGGGYGFFENIYGEGAVQFYQMLERWRDDGALDGVEIA